MAKVWFTSDSHFNHAAIIDLCKRPFNDVDEMNRKLISNWNNVVSKRDTVYHLGDFAFGDKEFITKIVSQLNGRIKLVRGNHDNRSNQWYRDCGFAEVYDTPIIYKGFFVLSHKPQTFVIDSDGAAINLFGHLHSFPLYETYGKRHVCVCVERHDYKPISFEDIKKHFEKYF